jgi:ferredoxin--NADP+ reductase
MAHRIVKANWLGPQVKRFIVAAPHVVRHCGPGQFVIIRISGDGERIPLTIARADRGAGTIELIVQAVGATTRRFCEMQTGEFISDVAGPLGQATKIENVGHAVIIGGGVGTAVIFPQAGALKQSGNRVSAIIGGRSKPFVILEADLRAVCDAVYPCTDDGSYGFKGFVTDRLRQLLDLTDSPVKLVLCAGPVPMMRAIAELTRPRAIHTVVSLNPIMVDGTGMCGGCRVQVGGAMKFACIDGPEFDAHQVDFRELADRLTTYREHEQSANDQHPCQVSGNVEER